MLPTSTILTKYSSFRVSNVSRLSRASITDRYVGTKKLSLCDPHLKSYFEIEARPLGRTSTRIIVRESSQQAGHSARISFRSPGVPVGRCYPSPMETK